MQKNILYVLVAVVILVIGWYLAALWCDNPLVLPQVDAVVEEAVQLLGKKSFWTAFSSSLIRCLFSLGMSFLIALVMAVLSVLYQPLYKLLAPIVTVVRSIPTITVVFILILVFNPKTAPIFVTFLVIMPSIYSMLISAFFAVDKELIETGRVFGFCKLEEATKIYLPISLPTMLEALAGGFSLSFKILVASEVLCSTAYSLGYLLFNSNINLQKARLVAITLITVVVCIFVEFVFRFVNDRVKKLVS